MNAPARATSKQALPEQCLTRKYNDFSLQGALTFPIAASSHASKGAVETSPGSSTHCHHCTRPIANVTETHAVPISFDAFSQHFVCTGRYCGLSCAKAAACELGSISQALFAKWCATKYGLDMSEVTTAPPRDALRRFGGTLSDEDFDKASLGGTVYELCKAPFVYAYTTTTAAGPSLNSLRRPSKPVDLSRGDKEGDNLEQLYAAFLASDTQSSTRR